MKTYINGWTKETVIEHVKANFKGKSESPEIGCAYRGPNGLKCIAGCFIPDAQYKEAMENICASALGVGEFFPFDEDTMNYWQSRHDYELDPDMPLDEQLEILLDFLER